LVLGVTTSHWRGSVHACGEFPAVTFRTMLERVAAVVAPAGTTLHEIDPTRLTDHSWYQKFPLWNGDESATVMDMDNSLARSLGMSLTSLEETTRETAEWMSPLTQPEWWLSAEAEAELLRG
jgi:nucleoside-diphosphate-sugar epimerase